MRYELSTSYLRHHVRAERTPGMNFPMHLHHSFEFFGVSQGEVRCTIAEKEYRLGPGDAVLVLPNQIHSYQNHQESEATMLIFDSIYVNEFYKYIQDCVFVNPVFRFDPGVLETFPEQEDIFGWKSLLYQICAQADRQCGLQFKGHKNNTLIQKTVDYIRRHLEEKITLEDMAKELGYSYHYLSGQIKENFGTNFCQLVHIFRVDTAATLLKTTNLTMTQVAEKSGFPTIRSFNRAFKQIHGISPSGYIGNTP